MKRPLVDLESWRPLYEKAFRFQEMAPWEWMDDAQMFGVADAQTGQNLYCTVLGAGGQVFALGAYRGDRGLEALDRMQMGELTAGDPESVVAQDCLMAEFVEKGDLEKEDKKILQALGYPLNGRGSYPLFRDFLPGWYPWFLDPEGVRLLTLALDRALDMAERTQRGEDILFDPPRLYPHYVPAPPGGEETWGMEQRRVEVLEPPFTPPPLDEVLVQRVKNNCPPAEETWMGDVIWIPAPIKGKDRPYYPRAVLWVDRETELILHTEILDPKKGSLDVLHQTLLETMLKLKKRPSRVVFRGRPGAEALTRLKDTLGVKTSARERLPLLERLSRELMKALGT